MSKSDVNTGFAKCFILFMAVVILVQGCLYLGLSIWGITQRNCSDQTTDISGNPFQFVIDLIYFISENCEKSPSITLPGSPNAFDLNVDWAKSYMVTNRMYIFIIAYAVVSGLWIVASLLVIATICGPVTKLVSAVVFWPWFLTVIAGSILDVVATGYHIHDIVQTTSAEKSFAYIGIANPGNSVMTFLESFDAYFITPAVVMTCVSSRVVIVWLLNIFGTSFCLSLSRVLSSTRPHHKHHKHQRRQDESHVPPITPATSAPYNTAPTATTTKTPYETRNESPAIEYVNMQNRPAPLVIEQAQPQLQTQNQMQRQLSRAPVQSPYTPNAPALSPDVVIVEEANRPLPPYNNNNNSTPPDDSHTYRKTDSHPDRLDYPPKTPSSPQNTLSSASILNNRYSTTEGFYTSSANQAPQRASDELRSQLPWSYTSMLGGKPQPPRKPQVQVYPQIPEPDYSEELEASRTSTSPPVVANDLNQSQQAYSRW